MLSLKIAFLWHKHQPDYKKEGEFLMPWTRLHGVKDYFDLPEILHEFPGIRQTFNLVPSLTIQLEEYISGGAIDRVQRLSAIRAGELNEKEKRGILKQFFLCNVENMILPYRRYKELYERALNEKEALQAFSEQDWRDLQVWYNLTWFGEISRGKSSVKRYFKKGAGFSEEEKLLILQEHLEILKSIGPQLISLRKLGQAEISVSPMYHPILPLLIDSRSALEAMPGAIMPEPLFTRPEDAAAQVAGAVEYYKFMFGDYPAGMWPSEGSISEKALEIMANAGLKWVAGDEEVLAASVEDFHPTEKFFPRKYITPAGSIALLFRDHFLSDRIGFVYSQWSPADAANDFCRHLGSIRREIIKVHGERALRSAVVPVILDGENCWEYYQDNGLPFLRELYQRLENDDGIKTVTCSEAVEGDHPDYLPPLERIRAGSWINANFSIWIGHEDDRKAWTLLANARQAFEEAEKDLSEESRQRALKHIYIAEGSDWFWWYGDEHEADNKDDFDVLFRWHIERVYQIIGRDVPKDAYIPIVEQKAKASIFQQKGAARPSVDGLVNPKTEWENAGYYDAKSAMSAMHQVGEILTKFWFAEDGDKIFFRCDTKRKLQADERIVLYFEEPKKFSILIKRTGISVESGGRLTLTSFDYAREDVVELAVSKDLLFGGGEMGKIRLKIHTISNLGEIRYPRQGWVEIDFS